MPVYKDTTIARRIAAWFEASARELPWRTAPRDPYRALVSEAMLQQTQVSRVVEKYDEFLRRFPTVEALAQADEHDVLAMWSGLGYYRRARHLHAAAKAIVERHGGRVPRDVKSLRALPGVGRYTAGAIASMVFNEAAPIVDGNVMRVLLRVHGRDTPQDSSATIAWAWERAEALVERAHRRGEAGCFNEGLMELGAMVCAPVSPKCAQCPLRRGCIARLEGRQEEIPRPKARAKRREIHHSAVVVRDGAGRLLVERRPEAGMWAGMWQAPTLEREAGPAKARELAALVGAGSVRKVGGFVHQTTHRVVYFEVWTPGDAPDAAAGDGRRWLSPEAVSGLALASPHRRILLGAGVAAPV